MGRFLFVAYPETGHVFPLVSAAVALQQRGHQVAFYSGRSFGQTISSANLTFCEPREWKSPKEENSFPTELLSDCNYLPSRRFGRNDQTRRRRRAQMTGCIGCQPLSNLREGSG